MNQNVTVKKVSLLFLLLFLAAASVWAQVFPVQATTQLSPPYSLYLADYVASGSERLALNVYLADIARPQLDVRFRLRIVGQGITIETKQEYRPAPVSIQGGVPLRLVSTDLADYFNVNNLNFQGITRREYEQRGKLPEGVYQFCFEVLEYNRGVKISNTACAIAWLVLNDPPIINLPGRDEKLKAQSPQNVLLQWTPRHTGSPNSAFTTEYEVTMVEVWPSTRNPNDAILTSPPILQTTTANTTFLYGPAETPLEPGRRYAFRIKAKSIAGVDELDLFKNNGYSEVYSFIYGDACDLPTGISVSAISPTKFTVAWQGTFNQTAFRVRYREVGTAAWYDSNVSIPELQVTSLKPGTTYEYQVAATCGFFDGQYTVSGKVTTVELPEAAYACNSPMQTFNLDPAQLTSSLKVGDVIDAGDFNVKLTKISGSNGVFSGEGVVEVPYFNKAKIRTSFTSISVNKEMRMVNGVMNVTGGGVDIVPQGVLDAIEKVDEVLTVIDSALNTIEENLPKDFDPDGFVADTLITVKDGIHSVYKNDDGSVVVVDKSGNTQTLPPGSNYAVKDSAGSGYLIDSKGNIHKTTADVAAKAGSREYKLDLNFGPAPLAKNGFDANKYPALARDYEQLKDNYSVAWKAVAMNGNDPVTAILKSTTLDKGKIKFEQGGNAVSAPPFTGQETTLSIAGKTDGDTESLLAIYPAADSTQKDLVLGKLNVATYAEITKSVVIVPVGNVPVPGNLTVGKISAELNKIYGQAVVRWNVSLAERLPHTPPSPFDDGESGLLTNYTADMKAVIKAFGALQDETFYLFLLDNPKSGRGLGYMPRSKQAGFIFLGTHEGSTDAMVRTMAHELGHGAFNLHHTFQEPNFTLAQGVTDNLMDYPAGDKLYKYQWDKMRYKDIVVGLFEEDEEGQSLAVTLDVPTLDDSGEGVKIDAECDQYLIRGGKLIRFSADQLQKIERVHLDGKILTWVKSKSGDVYTRTTNVETESNNYGNVRITKETITYKFVCFACAERDEAKLKAKGFKITRNVTDPDTDEVSTIYHNVPKEWPYTIDLTGNIKDCAPGEKIAVLGADQKSTICQIVTEADCADAKDEFKGKYLIVAVCDGDIFFKNHELLISFADGTTTYGEKLIKNLNYLIDNNAKKNKFGDDLLKVNVEDVQYIDAGFRYNGDRIFTGKAVLPELNAKMAYLEASTGYQLYTKFIETRCTFTQADADSFAGSVLNGSKVKNKGIICLVLRNSSTGDVRIGTAAGAGVPESVKGIVDQNLKGSVANYVHNYPVMLINAYKQIPKKRVVFSYFFAVADPDGRAAVKLLGAPYGWLSAASWYLKEDVANSAGNAVDAEYYVVSDMTTKALTRIINSKRELKEWYVQSYSPKVALTYAREHAKWDLEEKTREGNIIQLRFLDVEDDDDCIHTLKKDCDAQFADNIIFAIQFVPLPQRLAILPVAAAVAYYTAKGELDEAALYLVTYGLAETALPIIKGAAVKGYKLIRLGTKKVSDYLVAAEFKNVIKEGLTKEAVEALYRKELDRKCVEYLIPEGQYKNTWVKISERGTGQNEVLVGEIARTANGDQLIGTGYKGNVQILIEREGLSEADVKLILREVMQEEAYVLSDALKTYLRSEGVSDAMFQQIGVFLRKTEDFAKKLTQSKAKLTGSEQFLREVVRLQKKAKDMDALCIKDLSSVLQDIEHVVENHPDAADIVKYFDEMLAQPEKFKAGTVGLEIVRTPPAYLNGMNLAGLEQRLFAEAEDGLNRLDLLFVNDAGKNVYVDTKNYSSISNLFSKKDNMSQLSAYFRKIDEVDQLFIVIQNRTKFANDPLASAKNALQKQYKADNYAFYDELQGSTLFTNMGITNKAQFIKEVDKVDVNKNLTSSLYSILKINP